MNKLEDCTLVNTEDLDLVVDMFVEDPDLVLLDGT